MDPKSHKKSLQTIKKILRPIKPFVFKVDDYFGGRILRSIRPQTLAPKKIDYGLEEKKLKTQEVIRQANLPLPSERDLKRVEIIVLKYKAPEVENLCAKYIIENTEWPYKLTFYDNRPGTKNMSKIWNQLIRESTCDYVMIMDSDVFVPMISPCWLTKLMSTFDTYSDCLVVSPRVTRTSCNQQRGNSVDINRPPEKFTEAFANMCILYKKEVFEKVGYFDEEFLIYGSDSEWAFRCIKSGAGAYLRHDVLVDHVNHYSVKKESTTANTTYDMDIEREYAINLYNEKTK